MLAALRHNFGYKLIAVFIAVLLHYNAAGGLINAPRAAYPDPAADRA